MFIFLYKLTNIHIHFISFSCLHANLLEWWYMFKSWYLYVSGNLQWNSMHNT